MQARFGTTTSLRRVTARGFSLIEVLVASAIFLLIMVAVYTVYQRALESHKLGVNQADLIQSTRFGFEEMTTRIRAAGFEFDLDGTSGSAALQSDEPIEYMGATAIIVRANYDFEAEGDVLRGREEYLETGPVDIVTTGNDEIIAFALGKDEGDPNPPTETLQAWFDLDGPRDGVIDDMGEIAGEELVEIPNVALTDFSDPPYTLYEFSWTDPEDGPVTLVRRPLVDNILSLQLEYYDEAGNPLTPNGGAPNPASDANALSQGREDRLGVRMVKVHLRGMTPDPDLRYQDPNDSDPLTTKHRKFDLTQEVYTFNLTTRGKRDASLDEPEQVTDVQLCSGQCGMVRVDWAPGPPEDNITDHFIILADCSAGTPNYVSNPLASFIVVSDLDLTVNPPREYAVFDVEDNPSLTAGTTVCARVVARDGSGAEAPPADSDKNSDASNPNPTQDDSTVIQDYTRSEAPFNGSSTGYDNSAGNWPNAKADNSNSGVQITTTDSDDSYPLANRIRLTFQTPAYQLQRTTQGGVTYDWTTDPSVNGYAALDEDAENEICYRVESTPLDASDNFRTPTEELSKSGYSDRPNVYVFRVSGSDDSNWGPGQSDCPGGPDCITDPRNFVPYAGNLLSAESIGLSGSSFSFVDQSEVGFATAEGTDRYADLYLGMGAWNAAPAGREQPVKSLTPGEVYYYRVRVVDYCWVDEDADGIDDSTESDANPVAAWSTEDDFPDSATWREAAIRMSPFYPPMRSQTGAGNMDLPATGEDDSDLLEANLSDVDTYALPGYAIPRNLAGNNFVRPEKPTDLYVARANDSASSLLPYTDANMDGVPEVAGARVLFNAAKRTSPFDTNGATDPPEAVGYTWYRLYRKAATYTPGTAMLPSVVNWEPAGDPTAELVAEFRLSADGVRTYTIDRRSEVIDGMNSVLANDALNLPSGVDDDADPLTTDAYDHHYYKLVTVQVSDGDTYNPAGGDDVDLPPHVGNDGVTPASETVRFSKPSPGFLFPSHFYDNVAEVDLEPARGTGVQSIDVDVEMTPPPDSLADCGDVRSYRLLAYGDQEGNYLGSSDWVAWPAMTCSTTINRTTILQALRGSLGTARFQVELSEVDETATDSGAWDKEPRGARVRSDLLGGAGDYILNQTCGTTCGDNTVMGANILGPVVDNDSDPALDRIATYDGDRVLSITPEILGCNSEDFSLLQIEVLLSGDVPNLISAEIAGVRAGPLHLPAPEADDLVGGLRRLRWFEGSFCDGSGFCAFPVVDVDNDEIDLRLRFDDEICGDPMDPNAVKLEEFNFRVLVLNAGNLEELLCSQRGDTAPDNVPAAMMGDEPDWYCEVGAGSNSVSDCGRGPAIDPEPCGQNPDCETGCDPGYCPVNDDFNFEPDVSLTDSMSGVEDVVTISQQEDCSGDCNLELQEITVRFECGPDRDCSIENLPLFVSARLLHEDENMDGLPAPDVLPAPTVDRVPDDHLELTWTNLSDLEVIEGEEFSIEITLDSSMDDTIITDYHLGFGDPLPTFASCDWTEGVPSDREAITVPN